MRKTEIIMGMPITIEAIDSTATTAILNTVFDYFKEVDEQFSPYKESSELSQINTGLAEASWSAEMREVLDLCRETSKLTDGYFNIHKDNKIDPSGLVKGWSIYNASKLMDQHNIVNYYIEAGGDIQVSGDYRAKDKGWEIGIRNPFQIDEIIKVVNLRNLGIATSGSYIRGQHIYNPLDHNAEITDIVSLSVIGPNVYEADRFATAAFAMGSKGINFINSLDGFEGYMINYNKIATFTDGFNRYTV